jgi:hypothetical protein
MNRLTRSLLHTLLYSALPAAAACGGKHDVRVQLVYAGGASEPRLDAVTVIAAGEKSWWPALTPGKTVAVTLNPQTPAPQVTLLFARAGQQRVWESPQLQADHGYTIHITIDANGAVDERHCLGDCTIE